MRLGVAIAIRPRVGRINFKKGVNHELQDRIPTV